MAFEYFISRKTLKSVVQGKKVSKPIVQISVISIALAVVVNLITIAVVTGFQQEVRQKVSGFGSHIFIMNGTESSIYESEPIRGDQPVLKQLNKIDGIESVQAVGYKPVLLQSKPTEISYQLPSGEDTTEVHHQVLGAVIKGVNDDYNWSFFKEHLIKGKIPIFSKDSEEFPSLVLSQSIAEDLGYELNDTISGFFVKTQPLKRNFVIAGIYSTGLEEFDKKTVIGNLSIVQELNDWGIKAEIEVGDTLADGHLIIKANVAGGNGNYRYDWGKGYENYSGFTICPVKDTVIRLIASDYWSNIKIDDIDTSLPDTAYLAIKIKGKGFSYCVYQLNDFQELSKNYLDQSGLHFSIDAGEKILEFTSTPGKGSGHNYIGGFEVNIKNWSDLDAIVAKVKKKVDFIPTPYDELLKTTSIKDNQRDIFVWLDFLDLNVIIILVLMILIGIINMGSALLVLILIRTNFIGIMKAMGASNWSIRKIFLYQAGFLIGRGLIWGNAIGLTICFLQSQFAFIRLNPEVYYLSEVPIELTIWHWVLLNVGTLVVCLTALIIPSVLISRIEPVKSIKFN